MLNVEKTATPPSERALEQRARRAAKRAGMHAYKSRWRAGSVDNLGEFMLVENGCCMLGSRFDASAQDILDYCAADNERV
jgi:hypothetical protein